MSEKSRNRPVHHSPIERHNRSIILFLTVCSHQRRNILANERIHRALVDAWEQADFWHVGRYVIMANHMHMFCSPARYDAGNVSKWTAYWKRLVSMQCPDLQPIWQRDCWDTQLRQSDSYSEKWEYVRNNPVRAGLIDSPDSWPFQGTIHHLQW